MTTVEIPDSLRRLGGAPVEVAGNAHTSMLLYTPPADPVTWVKENVTELRSALFEYGIGALVLRGVGTDLDVFNTIVQTIGGEMLSYTERSTPRSTVKGNVYTSTEYPADQNLPMHNESSYSDAWPTLLYFLCDTPAKTGGATPVADSRKMLELIPADVRDRFADGVRYTRTFREDLGLTWQESFQTDDKHQVESYLTEHGQEFAWTEEGLRTSRRRPSEATEPTTGARVWFNQANLFHVSALDPAVGEALLEMYGEDDLPRNARFADGSTIPDDDIAAIRAAYDEASLPRPWEEGDVMVINNMLMAHGREPFTGPRRILVAMT